jgi:hypothetical protein
MPPRSFHSRQRIQCLPPLTQLSPAAYGKSCRWQSKQIAPSRLSAAGTAAVAAPVRRRDERGRDDGNPAPRRPRLLSYGTKRDEHDDIVLEAPAGIAGALDHTEAGSGDEYLRRVPYRLGRKVQLGGKALNAIARRTTVPQNSGEPRSPRFRSRVRTSTRPRT